MQLFDTWVGELDAPAYRDFELPATQLLIEELAPRRYARDSLFQGSNHLLSSLVRTGANVLSVDWRMDLAQLREQFGDRIAMQGNVDPVSLLASPEAIARRASISRPSDRGRGHILNLGHGILPETPVENALAFVRAGQSASLEDAVRVACRAMRHLEPAGMSDLPHSDLNLELERERFHISQEFLAHYNRPGPRYTSYPTAPVWQDDFGPDDLERAYANRPKRRARRFRSTCICPFARACACFAPATWSSPRTTASRLPTSTR